MSRGGILFLKYLITVNITNSLFLNNIGKQGTIVYSEKMSTIYVNYTNFTNNEALNNGAILVSENVGRFLFIEHNIFQNNIAS